MTEAPLICPYCGIELEPSKQGTSPNAGRDIALIDHFTEGCEQRVEHLDHLQRKWWSS